MSSPVHGAVDWADDFNSDKKQTNNKDIWLRLDEGNNVIRLVTAPHQYSVHKSIKAEGDKGFGQKVSCSISNGSCPLCAMDNKPGLRWLLGVIDRKTSSYRILDVSYQVYSQIRKLARETEVWGDPTKYDLNIIVDKKGGATGYYSVQPRPHKALSAEDQQIRDSADLEDLKRRTTPFTPEQVQKRLDKILNGAPLAAPQQQQQARKPPSSTQKKPPQVEVESNDDGIDDVFPEYNA